MLTVEFRYNENDIDGNRRCKTKTITIDIFDTLEGAVLHGNETLKTLSETFEVRSDDKFKVNGLFGMPDRLVTNTCYPTNGVCYFAKITSLDFNSLSETIEEITK